MAETTQFVSRISVKDLISAFESKSETVRVEFSRPRARSFGNVLNKNVIVRLNEFITLEDVEKGLTKLETNLNFYEVYNKAKHVAFQEQFFNILTSIANIENNDEDAPARKKRLISRTQTLVSFLNQKLPSNINQVVEDKPKNQYSYTPYSSYVKSNSKPESNATNSEESKQSNGSGEQPELYVESNSSVDITDSGEAYIVSVKKLKETFQSKGEKQTETPIKQDKTSKITQKASLNSSTSSTVSTQSAQQPNQNAKQTDEQPLKEEQDAPKEEKLEAVSVTKLRSLFEQRSEENSKGLEIITVDKSQLTKHILGGSIQNVSIPFTERNLGTFRLQRSVSGNYMNYSGLLKRIDIHRSTSAFDVNKENSPIVSESDDESSDVEVESTLGKKSVVIEEIRENDSPANLENQENRRNSENEESSVRVEENIAKFEAIATRAETVSVIEKQENLRNSEREHLAAIKQSNEVEIKHSSKSEQEENNNNREHNLSNGTTTFVDENENEKFSLDSENSSQQQGFKEEEVYFSSASLEGSRASEEELTFKSDEVEVNSGIPVSETVTVEENIAKFEAIATQALPVSEATENDSNTTTEDESSIKDVDEVKVNGETVERQNIQEEETVGTLEETIEAEQSAAIPETKEHVTDSARDDETSNSAFSSLLELEDERDRSLIEEEMKKIDVEQTLANADLVVNSEDLKNADDEFEKLIENTESGKIIG